MLNMTLSKNEMFSLMADYLILCLHFIADNHLFSMLPPFYSVKLWHTNIIKKNQNTTVKWTDTWSAELTLCKTMKLIGISYS